MKILIINASPRKNGNTNEVCQIITKKLFSLDKDIEVEEIFLSDINLKVCKGCCNCISTGDEHCPSSDDDRVLVEEKMLSSNGIIFASPVYAMNMTSLMKNFMDRFAFTMHRPRFFNQYTMLISVTYAFGAEDTTKSMSYLGVCGFNIIEKLNIKTQTSPEKVSFDNEKLIKSIKSSTEKFYQKVNENEAFKPSVLNLLTFNFQRKYFAKLNSEKYADYRYFKNKGWLNPKCNYYISNVKIPFLKNVLARFIVKIVN